LGGEKRPGGDRNENSGVTKPWPQAKKGSGGVPLNQKSGIVREFDLGEKGVGLKKQYPEIEITVTNILQK